MNNYDFDISIVGGGIVGLATAYKLQLNFPSLKIVVIEKEKELAFHQTGRNSGVLHSGLYYKPGSNKAINCVDGRNQLVEFSKKYRIKHDVCGKIVLAVNQKEKKNLLQLKRNGEQNGLEGLEIISHEIIKEIEPYAVGLEALFVPHSGIIDYRAVTNKFADLLVSINSDSKILKSREVLDIDHEMLITDKGNIKVRNSIFCGGLFSDRLAVKDNVHLSMKIVGFRGEYYELEDSAKHKVNNLIYPVPNPEFPFLGVHFTRMTDGVIECGPNAVFTFKREGYKKTDFDFRDTIDSLTFLGTWKLFINHWKFGLNEYKRSFSKRLFLRELQKMIPSLNLSDIKQGRSGVRAMSLGLDGEIIDDFKIITKGKNIHVLNAPSPAATACLSIADKLVNRVKTDFKLI
tara:strand:- start:11557 stop:12765 length:1209 start_codon:yes stop_codon:yes gene_type:complete